MHLLFTSYRINITILDEQQLEGLHVVPSLMVSQDEITCASLTVSDGKVHSIMICHRKIFFKRLYFPFLSCTL